MCKKDAIKVIQTKDIKVIEIIYAKLRNKKTRKINEIHAN
jgi:hypothetical protein